MNNSFNGWFHVDAFDLEKVVDLVLTNGTSESIQSDDWLLSHIGNESNKLSILDFGCGIGRNIFNFSQQRPNWEFFGYDNINMISKAKEYVNIKFNKSAESFENIKFFNDWDLLKVKKFDCVYATIVFQHIYEKDLNIYLQDIKKMTNKLIVSGRRFNDDFIDDQHKNTWQILENNGFYPSNANEINYNVIGDPNEHITCVYDI
jgi:SAM-dependent methyltransferase